MHDLKAYYNKLFVYRYRASVRTVHQTITGFPRLFQGGKLVGPLICEYFAVDSCILFLKAAYILCSLALFF